MNVGTQYTKATIDSIAGTIAAQTRQLVAKAELFKEWLDTLSEQDLISLGYTQPDADTLKSAFSEIDGLGLLVAIYHGAVGLPNPIDFSVSATRLSGPGI